MHSDLRTLRDELEAAGVGWLKPGPNGMVSHTSGSHFVVRNAAGVRVCTLAGTPNGGRRGLENSRAQLRRAGLLPKKGSR